MADGARDPFQRPSVDPVLRVLGDGRSHLVKVAPRETCSAPDRGVGLARANRKLFEGLDKTTGEHAAILPGHHRRCNIHRAKHAHRGASGQAPNRSD